MKMRRCEDEKMFYRPPLLEEPCAQTLSGKNDNVLSRLLKSNVFCLSVVLKLFSVFGFFISLFVVNCAPTNACQILHKEGAW